MSFRIRRMGRPASRLTLLATILLAAWFSIGCSNDDALIVAPPDDALIATPPTDLIAAPPTHASYAPPTGEVGLRERAFKSDVIVRAKLKSVSSAAELAETLDDGTSRYRGLVQFTFEVSEYLKGSGGAELVVVAAVDLRSEVIQFIIDRYARGETISWTGVDLENPYTSMELALEAAKEWKDNHDTRWDDREAIIMVWEEPVPGSTDGAKRYEFVGGVKNYALSSRVTKWLPSATPAGGASSGEARFLLKTPRESRASGTASRPETISLSEMKALIAKMEKWRKDGEGVAGHLECIMDSFWNERLENGRLELLGMSPSSRYDFSLASGLPRHTVVKETHPLDARIWLDGKDKDIFEISIHSNGVTVTTRPLPKGDYTVYHNTQLRRYIPCGYLPRAASNNIEYFIKVTAPTGTLHEAFFDPVTVGAAIAADATNGVLKPTTFTDGNSASATLQRIAWEAPSAGSGQVGAVKLKLSPHTGLANHVLDFIALDGTVSVSLAADEATVDAANNTLSWPVATQPWKNGDLLMLRIRAVPATPTPTPVPRYSCTIIDLGEVSGDTAIPNALGSGDCYDGGYTDFYAFTLKAAAQVRIDFESSDFDTYLKLRSGKSKTGDILAEHNDVNYHGGDTDSRINQQLNAGTYTIEATTSDLDTSGDYTLTLSVK